MRLILLLSVLVIGCGGSPQSSPVMEKTAKGAVQGAITKAQNPAQKEFYWFVQRHVEDPSNFTILSWGEKRGDRVRTVRFSCSLIKVENGKRKTEDEVTVFYGQSGRIETIIPDNGNGLHWE